LDYAENNSMAAQLTVLVLGVGGNVSQGILKALALSRVRLSLRVLGACISPYAMGLYAVEKAFISPTADDPAFLGWLVDICQREKVDAILSGVEPVLSVLSQHKHVIEEQTGAFCLVSNTDQLTIGGDKLLTCQWLDKQGFNFPRYAVSEDEAAVSSLVSECGYPLLAKPRIGKGSSGVVEIHTAQDLEVVRQRSHYVIEEYLGTNDDEYTVGCFSDKDGQVRGTIAMRRSLLYGTTYTAEVGNFPEVREEAKRIAEALRPLGPLNVQLRMANGRPVCFEMNVRFSGTTPLRARLGFNDVEASLTHYVLGQPVVDLPLITTGMVLRYWNEMYVDPAAFRQLSEIGTLNTSAYQKTVEDYGN
jgi:carbamoyl-phosphate synthase large subunit